MMAEHPANPQTAGQETEVVVGDDHSRRIIAGRRTQLWAGPLPPPDALNRYSAAAQSAIIEAFKAENKHRHINQSKQVDADIARGKRGQNYAFVAVMASLLVSGGLVYSGRDWGAIIMLGIIPAIVPQIENLLKTLKSLFGGNGKSNNKQHNSNEHSD